MLKSVLKINKITTYSLVSEVPENICQAIVKKAESKKRKVEEIAFKRMVV